MVAKKLDKKFTGPLTKVKDGSTVPDDEWNAFLAKDNVYAKIIQQYPVECELAGCDQEQVKAAHTLVKNINDWRKENPDKCHNPHASGERLLD